MLNTKKTKEMIVDFRKKDNIISPLLIDHDEIEIVSEYKYLGTYIDNKLDWNTNTQKIVSKANQRTYLLRKLKSFSVRKDLIKPIISFSCLVWFYGLTSHNKMKLEKVMKTASKVIGLPVKQLEEIARKAVLSKLNHIIEDVTHPLHGHIEFNRSGRIRLPRIRTNRFRGSFLPNAMALYNEEFKR